MKKFIRYDIAPYSIRENVISISIPDSATFDIKWVDLGSAGLCPEINAFSDAWIGLFSLPELIDQFKKWNDENPTIDEFAEFLLSIGFEESRFWTDNNKCECCNGTGIKR